MSVIRVNKTKNYTVMSNYHLRDKNISLKAKGLLSQMLSLPDDWDYTINGLVAINKENISAIKSTLEELKQCGYLVVTKLFPDRSNSGRIEYVYDIYEMPRQQKQEGKKQGIENLSLEVQPLEVQPVENPIQQSTEERSTEELNKEDKPLVEQTRQRIPYAEIIDFLNKAAGTNFKSTTKKTQKDIRARFNEGFVFIDFITVIRKKTFEWKGTDMEKYLRPETLFGTKFEGYLNQKVDITTKEIARDMDFSDFDDGTL